MEKYKGPDIIQCYKCQKFGHPQISCFNIPKCLKCGDTHLTSNCTRNIQDNSPTCANCGEQHTSNYRGCKVYKAILTKRRSATQKPNDNVKSSNSNAPQKDSIHAAPKMTKADTADTIKELFSLFKDFFTSDILLSISQDLPRLKDKTNLLDKIPVFIDILQKIFSARNP